jgi:protoporphyrinogen oxidase
VKAVVLGGGLAGLAAAWGLRRAGADTLLLEASAQPGGLASGFRERGYTFDLFPQRLRTSDREVLRLCEAWSGTTLLMRPAQTRVFVEGRFYHLPPRLRDLLSFRGFGLAASAFVGGLQGRMSWGKNRDADLAAFLTRRYGVPLYERFIAPYVEKVTGLPAESLSADLGREAIRNHLGRGSPRRRAGTGEHPARALFYPEGGFVALADGMARALQRAGAEVLPGCRVKALRGRSDRIETIEAEGPDGRFRRSADLVISTLPLPVLVDRLDPEPAGGARHAAQQLRSRAMVVVYLGVRREHLTGDHAVHVPDSEVRFHRLSETTAYSPRLAPRAATGLCLEIACEHRDALYREDDRAHVARAIDDLRTMGFLRSTAEVESAWVRRIPAALPLPTRGHQSALQVVEAGLGKIGNLYRCGRQGAYDLGGASEAIRRGLDTGIRAAADLAEGLAASAEEQSHAEGHAA